MLRIGFKLKLKIRIHQTCAKDFVSLGEQHHTLEHAESQLMLITLKKRTSR